MSLQPFEIWDLLPKQRLKEFLTAVTQDDPWVLSVLDAQGRCIMEGVSPKVSADQARQMLSGSALKGLSNLLLSTESLSEIHRDSGLPLYGAPLSCQGSRLGALIAWFPQEPNPDTGRRDFRRIWLHLQDRFSDGYDLNNLSSEIVRNYEELALLYNLSMRLGTQPDLNRIYQIVAEQVQSILPDSHLAVLLVDEAEGEIVSQLAVDGKGHRHPPFRFKLGQGITGQVISTGQPTIVCNVREHPAFVEATYPITSMLSVPIAMGEKVLGAINVSNKAQGAEFTTYDLKLISAIAAEAAVAIENARLFSEVKDLFLSAIKSLVMAIDAKDPYTHLHSVRVSEFSTAVAEVLGLSSREVEDIKLAGLLHDIGKIGVPERVLLKTGQLTREEWDEMKKHPLHSVQILEQVKQFEHLAKWVRHEHERYDGKGYPDGLEGDAIPLASRIIAVADAFDAITSDRYYRKRRSEQEALDELHAHAGTQFDPKVISAFLTAHREGRLQTNHIP